MEIILSIGQKIKFPNKTGQTVHGMKTDGYTLGTWEVVNIFICKQTEQKYIELKKGKKTYHQMPIRSCIEKLNFIKNSKN